MTATLLQSIPKMRKHIYQGSLVNFKGIHQLALLVYASLLNQKLSDGIVQVFVRSTESVLLVWIVLL